MPPSFQKLRIADAGPVRTITLYAPERRNAIGPVMVNELLHALEAAHGEAAIHVIVLTGEGTTFCAGGDFSQMSGGGDGTELPPKGTYADLLVAMTRATKPIIARVNGPAMGGGLGLVAASTFALAVKGAKLGTPEIDVGLFPMMIMAVLARLVPRRALLDMMLCGRKLSAEEALSIGILNRVADDLPALDLEVQSLANLLSSKSPSTLAMGLRAFADQDDMDLGPALSMLSGRLAECLGTEDAQEGLMAFLQKRPPVWKGR